METSGPNSFGELLKTYRKRQRLTQQQLARKLDIHQNTIGAWERGDYLPATRGIIWELGRCLSLSETETYHLLEISWFTMTFRWGVPYLRNPFFTGRKTVLQQLHTLLLEGQSGPSHRAYALRGLAGMGKTQIAVEYAYRRALDYTAVFWIDAETEESIAGSFAAIARILKQPLYSTQKNEVAASIVFDWLHAHRDWLLILDNIEQRELIQRFVPVSANGFLLLTTRLPTLGAFAPCLELQPLSLEESMQLLLSRANALSSYQPSVPMDVKEAAAARTIVTLMDGLPLALDQAAAYIEESQCRFSSFLSLLQYDALQGPQQHSIPDSLSLPI